MPASSTNYKSKNFINENSIISTSKDDFVNVVNLAEKWYFLIMDEQNHLDFIYFLTKILDEFRNNEEIRRFIQTKIEERTRTLVKIQKLRKIIEKQIRNQYKHPFFTFFLQNELNKNVYQRE